MSIFEEYGAFNIVSQLILVEYTSLKTLRFHDFTITLRLTKVSTTNNDIPICDNNLDMSGEKVT